MKRSFLCALLVMSVTASAVERPVVVRGSRALGMGDAFTAVADDQNVFFYNPAGTVQRTGRLVTLLDIHVRGSQDTADLVSFFSDNENKINNFDTLSGPEQAAFVNQILAEMVPLRPEFGLGLPNVSYLSGPSKNRWFWGWGVFAQVEGRVGFNPSPLVPSLYYDINADVAPMVNIAKSLAAVPFLPGRLGLGVNVKGLQRGRVSQANVSLLQLDNFDTPPLQRGHGVGADLGLLYQPTSRFNVGATWADVGGTRLTFDALDAKDGFPAVASRKDSIASRVNVGVSWTPARLGIGPLSIPTGDRLLLAADVRDILNEDSKTLFDGGVVADSAGKHIHLGAEYRWWLLRARAGANQGYATFGVGLDLPLLKIDYAYYSDETGAFAGSLKNTAHSLSLALRWGTGATEARERIKGEPTPESAAPAASDPKGNENP